MTPNLRTPARSHAAALIATLCLGCGARNPSDVPLDDLPAYTPGEARLYDDSIAVDVFEPGGTPAPTGALFERRIASADFIVPVRLTGISSERSTDSVRYELVTTPLESPLKGSVDSGPLRLSVGSASPSQGMLRSMDTQLVGTHMLVLARRYQDDGRMVVHFRAEPDTVDVRNAVGEALANSGKEASEEP